MAEERLDGLLNETRRNAVLGWTIAAILSGLALVHAFDGSYRWFVFTGFAVTIVLVPAVAFGDPLVMPPWELLAIVALPVVDAALFGESALTVVAVYVAVAAVALVVAVEIHWFTPVRMNHSFAIGLVVITTLAVAGAWNVAQWVSDAVLGTAYVGAGDDGDAANRAMMIEFVYAAVAGLLAGVVFDRFFRTRSFGATAPGSVPDRGPADSDADTGAASVPSLIRRLDVPESFVRRASRIMQVALAGVLLYGLVVRDATTITNAGIALAITFLPTLLERDARLPLEPELVFWLTSAVFLHSIGSAWLYNSLGVWDNMTHALSASIVAAAGYAVVRAIDLHTDEVYLPPKMMAGFILLFVLAFGVVWEIMEFAIDTGARWIGAQAVLAQHGVADTISDLVFDLVGAVVTAIWGSVYLRGVSHRIAGQFGG